MAARTTTADRLRSGPGIDTLSVSHRARTTDKRRCGAYVDQPQDAVILGPTARARRGTHAFLRVRGEGAVRAPRRPAAEGPGGEDDGRGPRRGARDRRPRGPQVAGADGRPHEGGWRQVRR